MNYIIEYADGRQVSPDAFRSENRNLVYAGDLPPQALLQAVGARRVTVPAYATAAEAKAAMVQWIDSLTAQVMDQYPRAVQARWGIEEAAARAVKAGTATQDQTDLVANEGAAKGRTPTEHADAIIANADRFRAIADQINKLFLATDKALTDATNPGQYEGILNAAISQAAPLAEAYGLNT